MPMLSDVLLVFSGLAAVTMAYLAWRKQQTNETTFLIGFLFVISIWCFSHVFEHQTTGQLDIFFEKLTWVAVIPAAFLWFAFVLDFTERGHSLTNRNRMLLFSWPVIVMVLIWVSGQEAQFLSVWQQFDEEQGIVFWSHLAISYGLLAIGSALMLNYSVKSVQPFRDQGIAITLGIGAAWIGSIVSAFELFGDYHIHALPIGFTVMSGFFLWAIFASGFIDISPVARRTVMETISAGVIAFDHNWQITTTNPAAKQLLRLKDPVVGQSVGDVFTEFDDLLETLNHGSKLNGHKRTISLDDRVLEVKLSPMEDSRDQCVGYVLLIHDLTEQHRRQKKLERQNKRLEEFASIVSHDLRNPLSVAIGHMELVRETHDHEYFDRIADALTRMDNLIDDVLTLGRQEAHPIEPTEIKLADVLNRCWRNVPTETATLVVESNLTLTADRSRLQQLFENLIRNAVEHGGKGVTITVGKINGGFYFEDDGVGIADNDYSEIFESGYTTANTGTGLGLAIVEEIATIHEWEVDVTESNEGGARFEFTEIR